MRRRLGWRIAARLPQTMEASGSTATSSSSGEASRAGPNTRTAASSTPALTTTAM